MIGTLLGAVAAKNLARAAGPLSSAVETTAVFGVIALVGGVVMRQADKNATKLAMQRTAATMSGSADGIWTEADCDDFLEQDYHVVVRELREMGFSNIHVRERVIKKGPFDSDQTGEVVGVAIDGMTDFRRNTLFPKDAYVVVEAITHYSGETLYTPSDVRSKSQAKKNRGQIRYCSNCGVKVSENQKFCVHCGRALR